MKFILKTKQDQLSAYLAFVGARTNSKCCAFSAHAEAWSFDQPTQYKKPIICFTFNK